MILNIFLFVGIIYLVIQCYKDTKEILKDNNETFKDWKKTKGQIKMFVPYFLFLNVKFKGTVLPIYYHNFWAPRIKGMPRHHNHTCTHKEARE